MALQLGPILYAEESKAATWRFSLLLSVDGLPGDGSSPFSVVCPDNGVTIGTPQLLADFSKVNGWSVWKWSFQVIRRAAERQITYQVQDGGGNKVGSSYEVMIPARGNLPRIALFSCNGFGKRGQNRDLDEPGKMWRIMGERHRCGIDCGHPDDPSGFHLLIGSGDQVYADGIGTLADEEKGLDQMSRAELRRLRPSKAREKKALREYLELYKKVWGSEQMAAMISRVPGVFTWDDHDIMDGWGSHSEMIQENVAYQEVYRSARQAFLVFQLCGDPAEQVTPPLVTRKNSLVSPDEGHLLQTLSFRESDRWVDIVVLDLRSHRTQDTVLSTAQWADLKAWLEVYSNDAAQATAVRHRDLLLVSSIPLVYLQFRTASFVLKNLIPGTQRIEDDLMDQWGHPRHHGERDRVIMTLLKIHRAAGARVTILSGDVHVAARGRVVSTSSSHLRRGTGRAHLDNGEHQAVIQQVVSSGIVHLPPSQFQHTGIELISSDRPLEISNGVVSEMIDIDTRHSRLRARTFATIGFDDPGSVSDEGRLWIEWVLEDEVRRRQVVVES